MPITLNATNDRLAQQAGFTLVEMLISLSLMAALLVSLAAVMNAALDSNTENIKMSETSQMGRSILKRICQDIRTATAVTTTSTSVTLIPPTNPSGVTQIKYDLTGGKLYVRRTISGTETNYVLLGDTTDNVTVETFTITSQAGTDYLGVACTATVNIQLKLDNDGNKFSLTASSSPRQNQAF